MSSDVKESSSSSRHIKTTLLTEALPSRGVKGGNVPLRDAAPPMARALSNNDAAAASKHGAKSTTAKEIIDWRSQCTDKSTSIDESSSKWRRCL